MGTTELLNNTDYFGRNALYYAVLGHKHYTVQFLLRQKVISLSRKTSLQRHSALRLAVEKGCPTITKHLLEYGFGTDSRDLYDRTPLAYLAAIKLAPECRPVVDTQNHMGNHMCRSHTNLPLTPSDIERHYKTILGLLIEHGAGIYALDVQGNTPREIASKRGNTMFATYLAEIEKHFPVSEHLLRRQLKSPAESLRSSQRVAGFDMDDAEEKITVSSEEDMLS